VFIEHGNRRFIDDFAHHPTAIRETIEAARSRWPKAYLRVAFEPRSNTTVTKRFQDALCDALASADEVRIGPIYRADRIAEDERLDRDALARDLSAQGVQATTADDIDDLAARLFESREDRETVLLLSNGAFGGLYDRLRALAAEAAERVH